MTDKAARARSSLLALHLEAPAAVARDVGNAVMDYVEELEARNKMLEDALRRCVPWMGKLIASGGHRETVLPNDAVRSLEMAEAALKKASEQ